MAHVDRHTVHFGATVVLDIGKFCMAPVEGHAVHFETVDVLDIGHSMAFYVLYLQSASFDTRVNLLSP